MYGSNATQLIRELTRNEDKPNNIPDYRYDLIEKVIEETNELYNDNLKTSQSAVQAPKEPEPSTSDGAPRAPQGSDSEDSDHEVPDNIEIAEKDLMVMQVRHNAELWNKRCLIAYHNERLNRLKKLRWEYGNNLPREIVQSLSKEELEWFTKYNDNLFSYMSSLNDGKGLDLTLYMRPPKRLYIQVKCLKDYGELDMEDGQPVKLMKNHILYLPFSQCQKLIHQGVLKQVN